MAKAPRVAPRTAPRVPRPKAAASEAKAAPAPVDAPDEPAEVAARTAAAPKPAPAASPKYFIIAETKALAASTAERDWGWKRTKAGWKDSVGNEVVFTNDLAKLEGHETPPCVYPGYRWYAAINPHHLNPLVKKGAIVMMPEPPKVEAE